MQERPILFSGPMVRAILNGCKRQTRRVVKVPWKGPTKTTPYEPYYVDDGGVLMVGIDGPYRPFVDVVASPYGDVGDRLWVRETWRTAASLNQMSPRAMESACLDAGYCNAWAPVEYDATPTERQTFTGFGGEAGKWRPSIHMPRWASRITLEVTGVRVERLQDISEDDARAEGIREVTKDGVVKKYCVYDLGDHSSTPWGQMPRRAVAAYAALWNDINGKGAFLLNPWVWVVEFRRL